MFVTKKTAGFTKEFVGVTAMVVQNSISTGYFSQNCDSRKIMLDGTQVKIFDKVIKTSCTIKSEFDFCFEEKDATLL